MKARQNTPTVLSFYVCTALNESTKTFSTYTLHKELTNSNEM